MCEWLGNLQVCRQRTYQLELQIPSKDLTDGLDFLGDYNDLPVGYSVAERDGSADPNALGFRGRDLIAHPLADDLSLELGKGKQHVQRETSHAAGGIEGLCDRYKRNGMPIEQFDELGEIGK